MVPNQACIRTYFRRIGGYPLNSCDSLASASILAGIADQIDELAGLARGGAFAGKE